MAFNLKNPNSVHLGTGILYVNGTDVGLLKGNVTFKYAPEYQEITGGSPEQLVKKSLIKETATLTAGMLEIDIDTIGNINTIFTRDDAGAADTVVVKEYLGEIHAGVWSAAKYPSWKVGETVAMFLATPLTAQAASGATVLHVGDASLFTAGDTLVLKDGATTETATIAALGVDESANTLTITVGLANSYTITGHVSNTAVSLVDGTDFFVNRINGQATILATSEKVAEGDTVTLSYTYQTFASQGLYAGGKMSTDYYPMRFESARSDGKKWVLEFYKAQLAGEFSMEFSPSDAMVLTVEISALADSTKTVGKQLFALTIV